MGIRYFERSIRPLARPLVGLPIGMALIALAACGATPADKTGQRQNELVTCNKISLGSIHDINPVIPSPKIQPWTQFETHEGVLQHIIGQSAIRDGLCSGPAPRDCVSVWMEDNIYYVRPLNFPNLLNTFFSGQFALLRQCACAQPFGEFFAQLNFYWNRASLQ